jgi:hypothetical protein
LGHFGGSPHNPLSLETHKISTAEFSVDAKVKFGLSQSIGTVFNPSDEYAS